MRRVRLAGTALVVALAVFLTGPWASARSSHDAWAEQGGYKFVGKRVLPGSAAGSVPRRPGSANAAETSAPRQYVWTPACGANRPGTAVGTVQDVSCGAATQCADGSILMALWSAPAGTTTWSRVRNQCLTTAQAVTAARHANRLLTNEGVLDAFGHVRNYYHV